MTLSNLQKVFFASQYAIDRILTPETTVSYSIAAGSPGAPTIDTHTISHSLGKAAFITFAFSVDGSNYYAQGNPIRFNAIAGTVPSVIVDAAVDSTTIYFYISNDNTSPQTVSIRYVLDNII
jgi:hypothetical protein